HTVRADIRTRKWIMDAAICGDSKIDNFTYDSVFSLYSIEQSLLCPTFILKQTDCLNHKEPRSMKSQIKYREFLEDFLQSCCVICIRMGENNVRDYGLSTKMLADMLYNQFARIQVPTIDDHQSVGFYRTIPNNYSSSRL